MFEKTRAKQNLMKKINQNTNFDVCLFYIFS